MLVYFAGTLRGYAKCELHDVMHFDSICVQDAEVLHEVKGFGVSEGIVPPCRCISVMCQASKVADWLLPLIRYCSDVVPVPALFTWGGQFLYLWYVANIAIEITTYHAWPIGELRKLM